ncbi:MAG: hypothetical protein RBR78_01650 [Flavobacteriaceae bacterium]|jgi:antitoxin component YwqK of YwqJK toxin-antitoxin module|nr:hypothetical protein [Flavobacteriaceae bacterium]
MRNIQTLNLLIMTLLFVTSVFPQEKINRTDENGLKHGLWKGKYERTENLKYEGTFEHGKEVGKFTFYENIKEKKVVATREFTQGKDEAYTIFYNGKFKVSEGWVRNREYDGEWRYYHYNSPAIMTLENYKNGKLEGVRKVFYEGGAIAEEAVYKDGIKNGSYKKYSENGVVLEESNFKNGEYDGVYINREADDKIILSGQYKNGKSVGIWKHYKNGKLVKEENRSEKKKARPKVTGERKRAKLNVKPLKE